MRLCRALMLIVVLPGWVHAQSVRAPALTGIVRDVNGGVLPGATVMLLDDRTLQAIETTATGDDGRFVLESDRGGRLRIVLSGFEPFEKSVAVDDAAGRAVDVVLSLSHLLEEVSVQGTISDVALARATHVERRLLDTLPSESLSSGLSSMLTLTSPGIAADSNGGFHPLGEHAETSFSIDNHPISDQQSRIFSNQLSTNAIESIDVFTGVPPAEFGDKTSAVASITTRSGLGVHDLRGSASLGYSLGALRMTAELTAASARFDDAADTRRMGGYALLNVAGEYPLAPRWTLFARLDNVLDKRYELAADFNTAGTSVLAGVRFRY